MGGLIESNLVRIPPNPHRYHSLCRSIPALLFIRAEKLRQICHESRDSVGCTSSLPLLLTSSAVAEAIIHHRPPRTSSVLCWMDGCVNKNRLSILSYAISSSFFSSYVDSERNHHHFHLLAVEHERYIYYHISISQGYLLYLLFLFAR